MTPLSRHSEPDPFVQELIEFSVQVAARPRALHSRSPGLPSTPAARPPAPRPPAAWLTELIFVRPELDHAPPVMPLRDRDVNMLAEFFDTQDIHDIEADVIHNLLIRWPEPCWEDGPYEFLREYL